MVDENTETQNVATRPSADLEEQKPEERNMSRTRKVRTVAARLWSRVRGLAERQTADPHNHDTVVAKYTRTTARATVAYVFVTALYVLVTFRQLNVLNQTVSENKRSADAAERAAVLAEESIKVTQEGIRLDQRAWVAPIEFPNPQIVPGSKWVLRAVVTNSGRTPALKTRTIVTTDTLPPGKKFEPIYKIETDQEKDGTTIMPNMRIVVSKTSAGEITQAHIDMFRTGALRLFFYGRINYKDIFGRPHQTTFCFLLKPSLTEAIACDIYNEAD